MADGLHSENKGITPRSTAVILEIDPPEKGGQSLKFPAVVRNLVAGALTIEVTHPLTILKCESLKGQRGCLRLATSESDELTDIQGTVTWARYSIQGGGALNLGLKLARPTQSVKKLLTARIPHSAEDIKGLWDRWDQAGHAPNESAAFPAKMGLVAAALLIGGLGIQLLAPKGYQLVAWVLWFFGTLALGGQTLQFWKNRKASR